MSFGMGSLLPRCRVDKLVEQAAHFREWNAMIDFDVVQGALRHLGISCVLGILDNCDPAAFLNRTEPCTTVVQHTGEYDADDASAVRNRRGPKQRIYGRSVAVFPRSFRD